MATIIDADDRHKALAAGTYDVPDLAAIFKCTERHVRNMAENGTIPGLIRFGRLIRFHSGIVNEWLATQAKGAARE
jgi:excisionase family DNA binding protein